MLYMGRTQANGEGDRVAPGEYWVEAVNSVVPNFQPLGPEAQVNRIRVEKGLTHRIDIDVPNR